MNGFQAMQGFLRVFGAPDKATGLFTIGVRTRPFATRFILTPIPIPTDYLPAGHHEHASSWARRLFRNDWPPIRKTRAPCDLRGWINSQLCRHHNTDISDSTMAYLHWASSHWSVSFRFLHLHIPKLLHQALRTDCTLTQQYYT